MKDDEYPPFKEGDLVRCQKFEDGNIKYYDALIVTKINTYDYLILTAGSVFDKQTTLEYNDDGTVKTYKEEINKTLYTKTSQNDETILGESDVDSVDFDELSLLSGPAPDDGLVRIGNLYDPDRQNSVYITSSEANSPYIQTISGVCRPDYTVLYGEPEFKINNRGLYEFTIPSNLKTYTTTGADDQEIRMIDLFTPKGKESFVINNDKIVAPCNYYIALNQNNTYQQLRADLVEAVKNKRNVKLL